jgi:hypothetical protein
MMIAGFVDMSIDSNVSRKLQPQSSGMYLYRFSEDRDINIYSEIGSRGHSESLVPIYQTARRHY